MNKEQWIQHSVDYRFWLEELKTMEDGQFFSPIKEGKWSVAAVISHLEAWDLFTLKERLPYMKEGAQLKPSPDFHSFNKEAEERAHNGQTKEQVIDGAIQARTELTDLVRNVNDREYHASCSIRNTTITMQEYLTDFMQHDDHHRNQIRELSV
ncbi:DinB family protein [Jeotgalibacillus proteolyticus]|uniref:DinB family protein n=1 Tax=Jeotgalibacillus proteolyticus TaxID=2082395 RepID=A0A2S5G6D9_9BACL|nr:DinB family protein [Jeotgalibacillus proteolyticus]PPA68547.1 DinB family protein [Jeotgalibacillus proteolyticus]